MSVTEWYPPESKPIRAGWYDAANFDAGWIYESRVWWDGRWFDKQDGEPLGNQNQTWRGLTEQSADGWIPWSGGECPVNDDGAPVQVRFANGTEPKPDNFPSMWDWRAPDAKYGRSDSWAIVAYRVIA